jgi:Spermidine/putrescine-binding periplasmic protein
LNKRKALFLLLTFHALFLAGCAKPQPTLYLYNWSYYTPESLIEEFEEEFDCRVVVDYFSSNEEMYSKISASHGGGYDIVFPSADFTSILIKTGLLAELDHNNIPNLKYLTESVKERDSYDPGFRYSVPYFMGAAGIAVKKDRVTDYPHSWAIFSDENLKNRMCMLDDMREVMGAALISLGYSVNSTDEKELEEAYELIETQWKPNLAKFDAEGFAKSFASGEYLVAQGYAESFFEETPLSEQSRMDFFIPEEGAPLYIDSMCILKSGKQKALAEKFINFILEPENYAVFLDRFSFPSTVNTDADKFRATTPRYSAEDLADCQLKLDVGEDLTRYYAFWEKIRYDE